MILSLLRVKDFEMEDMMRSSFAESDAQKKKPEVHLQRQSCAAKLNTLREQPWPEGPGRCASAVVDSTALLMPGCVRVSVAKQSGIGATVARQRPATVRVQANEDRGDTVHRAAARRGGHRH